MGGRGNGAPRGLLKLAALSVVYFTAAKSGLAFAFVNPSATAIWPPTGIALAAFLVLGYGVWPAILIGAFLANLTTQGSVAASIAIGLGNTLEGLVGAYLVDRFANGRRFVRRPRYIFLFAGLGAMFSTTLSASVGVTSLALAGLARRVDVGSIWLTWWLGDAAGDLVVAPLIVLWSGAFRWHWGLRRSLEAGTLDLSLATVAIIVFHGLSPSVGAAHLPLIKRSQRTSRQFAVLLLDLDGLKQINDGHGHLVGNRALCRVADALRASVRTTDVVARFGGDEFACVLSEASEAGAEDLASRVGERLASDLEQPQVSVSLGWAVYPRDGATPGLLLDAADHALYAAKLTRQAQSVVVS